MNAYSGLKREERLAIALAGYYRGRGYTRCKFSSFEEYSVFSENEDFLSDKGVIAFGAPDGKLLALRPDVTLSALKNARGEENEKLFYNEKVYRICDGSVRELSQTGVEVIGDIDIVTEAEIVGLILGTLDRIGGKYFLDISHMGFVSAFIKSLCGDKRTEAALYGLLKAKNTHDARKLPDIDDERANRFAALAAIDGDPCEAIAEARALCHDAASEKALDELAALVAAVRKTGEKNVNVNFSITGNVDYYNGVIFNGYIEGVPRAVIFGGRYDKLAAKLGKTAGAIGFALYLGELERYFPDEREETDALLLYGDDPTGALNAAETLNKRGYSVLLAKRAPSGKIFDKIYKVVGGEAVEVKE